MKKPVFTKPVMLICILPILWLGYWLLPDSHDVRENVYDHPMAPFLAGFYHSEKVKDAKELPDAEIVSKENRQVSLRDLIKGRIAIVNFWASWCAPCLEEMPSLAKFQMANPDILIVPVSLDMQKTMPELASLFDNGKMRDLRWFYDQGGALRKNLSLSAYPTTYILDRHGRTAYILQGPGDWASKDAQAFAKALSKKF